MTEPTQAEVWLSVSFDATQIGHQLCWTATEGRTNLLEPYGKFAGSLHLPKGHGLRVEVHGYGDDHGGRELKSFEILSVCLVTMPSENELPPSPFEHHATATVEIKDFPICHQIIDDPHIGRRYGIATSERPLQIIDQDGAWQISMILTVRIHDGKGTHVRVFRFDPESQVGNGTR